MPSELPRLPKDTHESLLRRHHAPGCMLQAGEVAVYRRRRREGWGFVIFGAVTIAVGVALIAIGLAS